MGDNTQLTAACSSNKDCAGVCVCMYVRVIKKMCWLICAGMSDDWVIYSNEKWMFKKNDDHMLCVFAMCTSALVNGCEWFIQYTMCLFVLKE